MQKSNQHGSVIIITLMNLLVGAVLVGIVMSSTMTVARNADRSRKHAAAQAAAEGAIEYAYALWLKRTNDKHGPLASSADLALSGPSFSGTLAPPGSGAGFEYTANGSLAIRALDKYGVAISGSAPEGVIGPVPGYPGWWGETHTYAATAQMQPVGNSRISAGARRLFYYTEVSMFQTMYFFNDNLEIYNPAPITINGLIHSNKAIYFSVTTSANFKINGQVTTAGKASLYGTGDPSGTVPGYSTAQPPLSVGSNYDYGTLKSPTWTQSGGISSQLKEVAQVQPLGTALQALFDADAKLSTHNPNLVNAFHELIEMPDTSQSDPLAGSRLFNKAGLIIKITGTTRSGTIRTTTTSAGDIKLKPFTAADVAITTASTDSTTQQTTINPIAGLNPTVLVAANWGANLPVYDTTKSAANQSQAYKDATANIAAALTKQLAADPAATLTSLTDQRVGSKVNVTNIDVGALNTVISSNLTGNFNGVVYVGDTTTDATYANTIRLLNGKILPADGLTVASPNPVYVQGDFNTGYAAPSTSNPSLYGLVEGKSTGVTTSGGSTPYSRAPSAVIGDAVILLSNNWNDLNSSNYSKRTAAATTFNTAVLGGYMPSVNGSFSGGAINYPRFLENWSSKGCVYWGSMVQLFPSKVFTQTWQAPGNYYSPPDRYFNFDPQFLRTKPPGSVTAVVLSRGPWTKF